jgi:cytochrome c oxidase subunit 3
VTGKVLHLSRKMPAARRRQVAPNGVIGMMTFLFTEVMFFAGLISAHAVVKNGTEGGWPPPGQPRLPVQATMFNTLVLLASGAVLVYAHRAFRSHPQRARRPLLLSIALGAFFVIFQGVEWVQLIGEGLTLTSSTHGGLFYLLIGSHAAHAVAALLALGFVYWKLIRGELVFSTLLTAGLFWYFVVGVWPILYWKVYL